MSADSSAVSLWAFFQQRYLPQRLRGRSREPYETALKWFTRSLGRDATSADLNAAAFKQLNEYLAACPDLLDRYRSRIIARLRAVWRFADRLGVSCEKPPVIVPPAVRSAGPPDWWRLPPLPDPKPGTLRHFFEETYRPQRLVGRTEKYVAESRFALRVLLEHFSRDLRLDELTDALMSNHLEWLVSRELSNQTVNNHRSKLLAIWRLAHARGLIALPPMLRKLPVTTEEPDAWSVEEMTRLIDAAGRFRAGRFLGPLPAGDFWRALLLVTWWTGLRRASLFALRRDDVDLAGGWVYSSGRRMKARRGMGFRIGADAIAAVRTIWLPARELLFPWPSSPRQIGHQFNRIIRDAGLRPSPRRCAHFHKIRRSTASHVAAAAGLHAASELLGHSSSEITKRYIDPSKLPGRDATRFLPSLVAAATAGGIDSRGDDGHHVRRPSPAAAMGSGVTSLSPDTPTGALDLAEQLLSSPHYLAAAMPLRVAIERSLQGRCRASGGLPKRRTSIGELSHLLLRRGLIDSPERNRLGQIGNRLARVIHGNIATLDELRGLAGEVRNLVA